MQEEREHNVSLRSANRTGVMTDTQTRTSDHTLDHGVVINGPLFNDQLFNDETKEDEELCAICQHSLYANDVAIKELCVNRHVIHLHCFRNIYRLGNPTRCCLCNAAVHSVNFTE